MQTRVIFIVTICVLAIVGGVNAQAKNHHHGHQAKQIRTGGMTAPKYVNQASSPAGSETKLGDIPVSGPTVPGRVGQLIGHTAYAPADAPVEVQRAIWAGNQLQGKPYIYGGGHQVVRGKRPVRADGYDCSGTVSYVLVGIGALDQPLDSGSLQGWGEDGSGEWITVYAHGSHTYMTIAGLRLDTSGRGGKGPRWRAESASKHGFTVRHPEGL